MSLLDLALQVQLCVLRYCSLRFTPPPPPPTEGNSSNGFACLCACTNVCLFFCTLTKQPLNQMDFDET